MEAIKNYCMAQGKAELFCQSWDNHEKFTIRSLDMQSDIPLLHNWVNLPYAITYWQMNGDIEKLKEAYRQMEQLPHAHSFIGCLNGVPVCQLDVYDPAHDVLGQYYPVQEGDIGIHLLLSPHKTGINNFSARLVWAFCECFFQQPGILRIVAEPDHRNRPASWLLRRLKFNYQGLLALPDKQAAFFMLTREQFLKIGSCPL